MRCPVPHPGLAAALLFAALPHTSFAASFPPDLRFRSVSTDRVTVHYHQGLEPLAREAATLATELLASHESRYGLRVGRVQVVLADVEDEPNGFASPLPYPLVHLRAVAPRGADEFGNHDGWLRLVLSHELAHVVHLDEARGVLRLGRRVFGRAPFLFPNGATPTWMVEGLATFEETEATAFGRGRNPDARMVLRMEAVERGLPRPDEAVGGLDRWPGGTAPYLFGESFLRYLTARFGPETLPDLSRAHAERPVPFLDDLTALKVTGATFVTRWNEWRAEMGSALEGEAARLRRAGLTSSRAVTARGVRQYGARFSPGGDRLAYTNRSLTRFRAIHLVGVGGSGDRALVRRNGGSALSWTADGARIVFDQPDVHRRFSTRFDLYAVDVATGRTRRLTRGLRARDPDVSPSGRVVFVRQGADRSELAVIPLDGGEWRDLTRSEPGTHWSNPRWSPSGDSVVAGRLLPGGWLDLVQLDLASGALAELTHDRAKDVEPAFTPDGAEVVFRSDRDGVSNLYALGLGDRRLRRVTNVLGGAFAPDVAADGRQLAFASYSARGYDVHVMDLAPESEPAPAFEDPYPAALPAPPPAAGADRAYAPLSHLRPRFWTPYLAGSAGQLRIGAATGGADPLLRHVYGLDVHATTGRGDPGVQVYYQYDRFLPTLVAVVEDSRDRLTTDAGETITRRRSLTLRASLPLVRRVRWSQSLSLAWRRERERVENGRGAEAFDSGGLEAAWSLTTARQYPWSISPIDGTRLRVAYLKEDPALGSTVSLGKLIGDVRTYRRLFGETDTLAVAAGGGTTFGGGAAAARSFALGGFPDRGLLDVFRTNHAVLRGYDDGQFRGRRFAHANLEYRFPLGHPQRGAGTAPVLVRHLHAAVFADAGHAWNDRFRWREVKTSAGLALGADLYLAHALPLTGTIGFAQGLARRGDSTFYVRAGLAF
jgi:Tol biopolymer transport system component